MNSNNTANGDAPMTVEQADREVAAEYGMKSLGWSRDVVNAVTSGRADDATLVQAFARHRLAGSEAVAFVRRVAALAGDELEAHASTELRDAAREVMASASAGQHPDDIAVDRFADAMKAKLSVARETGRGGWDDPAQCTVEHLRDLMLDHVAKGDPVDVANFCMMLFHRGGSTFAPVGNGVEDRDALAERLCAARWRVVADAALARPRAAVDRAQYWTDLLSDRLGADRAGCWRCGAISKALDAILTLEGYTTAIVQGSANGVPHVWVEADGVIYDATAGQFNAPIQYSANDSPRAAVGEREA